MTQQVVDSMKQRQPFSSGMAYDPWASSSSQQVQLDVADINKTSYEKICSLIAQKVEQPQVPLAGLILGEAGSGKTHFLRRILQYIDKTDALEFFCVLKPLFDPNLPLQHLLQAIGHDLAYSKPDTPEHSQLDYFVAKIFIDCVVDELEKTSHKLSEDDRTRNSKFLEKCEENPYHVFTTKKYLKRIQNTAVEYLLHLHPDFDKTFLKVLLQYCEDNKRDIVREWLRGNSLNESDCRLLDIPFQEDVSLAAVQTRLTTFYRLFERYHFTLVLCFDQLDDLYGVEEIRSFGKMINFVVNQTTAIVPLVFVRGDNWDTRFRALLDPATVQRLESLQTVLQGCFFEQAQRLICRRIEQSFKDSPELESIKKAVIAKFPKQGVFSPREVIQKAQRIWEELATGKNDTVNPVADKSIATEYQRTCEEIDKDFNTLWLPDDGSVYLKTAAQWYLQSRG
ncbi:MAG: ATP-binding protein, partial [Planctomycetaceae bacterium]|nr:ATP-binding protein [Planctomycetaceae bacterium]